MPGKCSFLVAIFFEIKKTKCRKATSLRVKEPGNLLIDRIEPRANEGLIAYREKKGKNVYFFWEWRYCRAW